MNSASRTAVDPGMELELKFCSVLDGWMDDDDVSTTVLVELEFIELVTMIMEVLMIMISHAGLG